MNKDKRKFSAQRKSTLYFIFLGAATVSVFAGQMHVGSGFNRMAEALEKVLDSPIMLDIGPPMYNEHPMIIR